MADILVVYGTSYGQTARIVKRMAERLTELGNRLSVWRGDALPSEQRLEDFDAVVVAGSVYFGRHQRHLAEFVRDHLSVLNRMPSAFVSVCGALASDWPLGHEEARKYVQRFLNRTGWRPEFTRSFAGGLAYTQYGPLIRWVMRRTSRRTGRPTDASRDWDFTDWPKVDRFAEELDGFLKALFPVAPPTSAPVASLQPSTAGMVIPDWGMPEGRAVSEDQSAAPQAVAPTEHPTVDAVV